MASGSSTHDDRYESILSFSEWMQDVVERTEFRAQAHKRLQIQLNSDGGSSTKELALSHAIDGAALETGAIEGLYRSTSGITISVIDGSIALAAAHEADTREVLALIAGQRAAYDLALDVMTEALPLSEALIRRLHETACEGQEFYDVVTEIGTQKHRLKGGTYKHHANHVRLADGTVHAYCPVQEVSAEMGRLLEQATSKSFSDSTAVAQAAYLHHALTHIHPFADGNGRTARVLASIPLLRAHSIPFIVFADRDGAYRASQAEADVGNTAPFVRFIETSTIDVLNLVATRLETDFKKRPDLGDLASRIKGVEEGEAKRAADSLHELLVTVGPEVAAALELPAPFSARFDTPNGWVSTKKRGMERVGKPKRMTVSFEGKVEKSKQINVYFLTSEGTSEVAQIRTGSNVFGARTEELLPRATVSLRARLSAWLEGVATDALADLNDAYS